MNLRKRLGRWIFRGIPSYNSTLYRLSQRYVDRYNGDNDSDPSTNGEEWLLHNELPGLREGVVLDVGANVGNWATRAMGIEPTIQLHCFEPSGEAFRRLSANLNLDLDSRRWAQNVHLNNFGLGDTEGKLELNIVGPSSGLNGLYARRGVESYHVIAKEVISITTADAYCERNGINHIHFCKIDVEGHEFAVLKGMRKMLGEGRVQTIQFEYGGCNLDARVQLAEIWEYLTPFGFLFHKLYPNGPKHVPRYSQALETFRYSNYIARMHR